SESSPTEKERIRGPRRFEPSGDAIAIRDLGSPVFQRDDFVQQAQFRSTGTNSTAPSLSPDGFVPRKRKSAEAVRSATPPRPQAEPAQRIAMATRSTSTVSPPAIPIASGIAADDLSQQLNQIEIDLSLMLAQDKSQWNLAPIRQKLDQLVE